MATGNITTTTAAVFLPALWSMETQRAAEAALVTAPLVKRFDSMVKERGQVIHIPKVSNLSARAKAANTDVTFETITESEATITINNHYYAAFAVEDIVKVQSNYDLMAEYTSKSGYAVAQKIDTDLLAQYSNFTNSVGTYGTDITDSTIVSAIQYLNQANAPMEDRAFVIAPSQLAAIMKIDKFTSASYLGRFNESSPVTKGPNSRYLWGEIYGIPVYYTTQVPVTVASPNQTNNILIHKEALALALQQAPRTQAQYYNTALAWKVTVDAIYGLTTYRADFGVTVKS